MKPAVKGFVIALLLLVSACGSPKASTNATTSSTPKGSSSTVPTATAPTGQPLLAVLESKLSASGQQADTVVIAGLDGYARAKAQFAPIRPPIMQFSQNGDVISFPLLLPPQAYVAAGKVFFLDGRGAVRSLSPSNSLRDVISLPKTSDQELVSFAVSPDGTRILGSVLSIPSGAQAGSLKIGYDVFSGPSGGTATLVRHGVGAFSHNAAPVPELVGWDNAGPLGTMPSEFFPQGGPPGRWHGSIVRLDSTAQPAGPLGTSDCRWEDETLDGTTACLAETDNGTRVVVRRPDGSQAWSHLNQPHAYSDPVLTPDGKRIGLRRQKGQDLPNRVLEGSFLLDSTGSEAALPADFVPINWATSSVLVGATTNAIDPGPWPGLAPLSYVRIESPGVANALGFSGSFIGGVTSS